MPTALYLFGSTVRDEAGKESDLDLFVDYDPGSRFNAFDLVGIKLLLEQKLQVAVDVTTLRQSASAAEAWNRALGGSHFLNVREFRML